VEYSLQQTVGRSVKAYRQAQGLSQEAFAHTIGVHRTYLGGIERGELNLTLKSVERIAKRIGLDPLALLGVYGRVVELDAKDVGRVLKMLAATNRS
jgi:transcriptional regulator with XRE-family HTH domain